MKRGRTLSTNQSTINQLIISSHQTQFKLKKFNLIDLIENEIDDCWIDWWDWFGEDGLNEQTNQFFLNLIDGVESIKWKEWLVCEWSKDSWPSNQTIQSNSWRWMSLMEFGWLLRPSITSIPSHSINNSIPIHCWFHLWFHSNIYNSKIIITVITWLLFISISLCYKVGFTVII